MSIKPARDPIHLLIAHNRSDIVSGAERVAADLARELEPGFQTTMIVSGEGRLAEFYRQSGFPVWVWPMISNRRLLPGLHTLRSRQAAQDLRAAGVDLALANTFAAAGRWSKTFGYARLPYAVYLREYISDRPVNRQILERAGRILCVSQDLQRHIQRMTGPGSVFLAYDPIRPQPVLERIERHRASGVRRLPFEPEMPVIGFAGRLTPSKQPHLLILAARQVLEEIPQARFAIIGAAQPKEHHYELALKKMVQDLGLGGKVAFLGQREDARELISELAVLCLPSRNEPLGRVLLEAQLAGCPVVGASSGGIPEIIEDGVTGLLFSLAGDHPQPCAERARPEGRAGAAGRPEDL